MVSYAPQLSRNVLFDLCMARFGTWPRFPINPPTDPVVRIQSPQNHRSIGPRPKIDVTITVGDYTAGQIDLNMLDFRLDGEDITPLLKIRSSVDPSLRRGKLYESVRLTARPLRPLARGTHTLSMVAQSDEFRGSGPGKTKVNWTFTVQPDQEDSDDDDHDEAKFGDLED